MNHEMIIENYKLITSFLKENKIDCFDNWIDWFKRYNKDLPPVEYYLVSKKPRKIILIPNDMYNDKLRAKLDNMISKLDYVDEFDKSSIISTINFGLFIIKEISLCCDDLRIKPFVRAIRTQLDQGFDYYFNNIFIDQINFFYRYSILDLAQAKILFSLFDKSITNRPVIYSPFMPVDRKWSGLLNLDDKLYKSFVWCNNYFIGFESLYNNQSCSLKKINDLNTIKKYYRKYVKLIEQAFEELFYKEFNLKVKIKSSFVEDYLNYIDIYDNHNIDNHNKIKCCNLDSRKFIRLWSNSDDIIIKFIYNLLKANDIDYKAILTYESNTNKA